MQLSAHHSNLLMIPTPSHSQAIETPTKRTKIASHSNIKTAETPDMSMSASKLTIADIEAEELFNNFSRIVAISESTEEFEAEPICRKIKYEKDGKLDFDLSDSHSMKKKRRGSRLLTEEGECIKLNAPDLDSSQEGHNAEESSSP